MNTRHITLMTFCSLASFFTKAQTAPSNASLSGTADMILHFQPWLSTSNAAGLGANPIPAIGSTTIGGSTEQGGFRRPQQPKTLSQICFQSERYQSLKRGTVYGSFKFIQQWDKDLRLSSVLNPYRGNPYILLDSLGGDWNKQMYELDLKASTLPMLNNKLNLGMGLSYKTGSGARQNDPRPQSTINELSLLPGALLHLNNKNRIGINGVYKRYNEETSILVNVNGVPQYVYKLLGLGMYLRDAVPGLGTYSRIYKGNTYGGDVQYEFRAGRLKWLTSAGIERKNENAIDGITTPREGGKLEEKRYNIQTSLLYNSQKNLHSLQFKWEQFDRSGTESFQVANPGNKYETIYKNVFTTSLVTHAHFVYELINTSEANDYNWLLTAGLGYIGQDNKYLYPRSRQIVDIAHYDLGVRKNWRCGSANNVQAGLNISYLSRITAKYNNVTMPSSTDYVAKELFLPDQGYLGSNAATADISLQYAFSVPKVNNTQFFIKANGFLRQQTGNEYLGANGNRTQFAITLGAFY